MLKYFFFYTPCLAASVTETDNFDTDPITALERDSKRPRSETEVDACSEAKLTNLVDFFTKPISQDFDDCSAELIAEWSGKAETARTTKASFRFKRSQNMWQARIRVGGRIFTKSFSTARYGDRAAQMAEDAAADFQQRADSGLLIA